MRASSALLVVALLPLAACTPGPGSGDCASSADCAADDDAPCAGCPSLANDLCLEGACESRGADEVEVVADVNIDRGVASQVVSFVHVVAAARTGTGALTCAAAFAGGAIAPEINVLAAGYKSVSGGSFHDGITFGRVPAGDVALLVVATDANAGEGAVLATGCAAGLSASGTMLSAGVVDVDP